MGHTRNNAPYALRHKRPTTAVRGNTHQNREALKGADAAAELCYTSKRVSSSAPIASYVCSYSTGTLHESCGGDLEAGAPRASLASEYERAPRSRSIGAMQQPPTKRSVGRRRSACRAW